MQTSYDKNGKITSIGNIVKFKTYTTKQTILGTVQTLCQHGAIIEIEPMYLYSDAVSQEKLKYRYTSYTRLTRWKIEDRL